MNRQGNILLVDDEASLRHTLIRVLQHAGCEVTPAASGAEALRLMSSASYDLIYLDIHLPDMGGLDVLKEIHQRYPNTPVILFTAYASVQSAVDAIRLGAIDYLIKPIDPEAFIARTRVVIAERVIEKRKHEIQDQIQTLRAELEQLEKHGVALEGPPPAQPPAGDRFLKRGNLILDMQARRGTFGDKVLALPPAAFDYLVVLARRAPETVEYQTLVNEAQGYTTESSQAKELAKWHIHQLRDILEPEPDEPQFVLNVRGIGYRLVVDASADSVRWLDYRLHNAVARLGWDGRVSRGRHCGKRIHRRRRPLWVGGLLRG